MSTKSLFHHVSRSAMVTLMGWQRTLRAMERSARREAHRAARAHEKDLQRLRRAMAKQHAADRKAAELAAARAEVALFDAHLKELTSIHRESHPNVDWRSIANAPAPAEPRADRTRSALKHFEIERFRPGLIERTLGIGNGRARLERELAAIRSHEDQLHITAVSQWKHQHASWKAWCALASRVLAGDTEAYREVVDGTECLGELVETLGAGVSFRLWKDSAVVELYLPEDDVIPSEEKKLTSRGKITTKKMAASRRMDTFQDFACGSVLRGARELLAVLPISGVLVHADTDILDTSTGHRVRETIVSAYCPREELARVNWEAVDASDLIERLLHRMKLRKSKGFSPVERLAMPNGSKDITAG